MKVYICTDHDTFYSVGGCSIVVAKDEEEAKKLLTDALLKRGLDPTLFTLRRIKHTMAGAEILLDGDY